MTAFRDWPKTLRPASYRGATFYVESDEIETGRRLEIHEFPHADAPYVEDLGRRANTITVTAYVLSDAADREAKALMRACDAGGAALLSLPLERLQAHCESCSRAFERDRLGFIGFNISFVREGLGSGGPFPVGYLASLVSSVAGTLRAAVPGVFATSYRGLRVPGWVVDAAVADIRTVAALCNDLLLTAPFQTSKLPALLLASTELYAAAPTLARTGAVGPRATPTSYLATDLAVSTDPLALALFDLTRGLAAATAGEALDTLAPLLALHADLTSAGVSGWKAKSIDNSTAIGRIVRHGALTGFAERIALTRFDDRRAAIQARADVAELFDFELQRLVPGRDHEIIRHLSDVAGRTAEYLSRQIADLAPIVIVEAPRRMPSLWWSQRLYGTADRAGELALRNAVKHPSFMPFSFEAKSR